VISFHFGCRAPGSGFLVLADVGPQALVINEPDSGFGSTLAQAERPDWRLIFIPWRGQD